MCAIVLLYIGLHDIFVDLWIYIVILFIFSDKLYKEIRDLNFEVVVQVHSIDFNSCLFHMNELCGNSSVVLVIPAVVIGYKCVLIQFVFYKIIPVCYYSYHQFYQLQIIINCTVCRFYVKKQHLFSKIMRKWNRPM